MPDRTAPMIAILGAGFAKGTAELSRVVDVHIWLQFASLVAAIAAAIASCVWVWSMIYDRLIRPPRPPRK
jgi:hypothetical protein